MLPKRQRIFLTITGKLIPNEYQEVFKVTVDPQKLNLQELPTLALTEKALLPNVAAIYFVLDGTQKVCYIGRAKSLCFRWYSHHRLADFREIPQVRVAYLTVSDAALLPDIEEALIEYFDPPLNQKRVSRSLTVTIAIKMSHDLRNRFLGKLRTRGTTMQSFFHDLMTLLTTDDALLDLLEEKRKSLSI